VDRLQDVSLQRLGRPRVAVDEEFALDLVLEHLAGRGIPG
jgi:hypothetical protein